MTEERDKLKRETRKAELNFLILKLTVDIAEKEDEIKVRLKTIEDHKKELDQLNKVN